MNCEWCGIEFIANAKHQRFCCKKHARAHQHAHEADGVTHICKRCKKEFKPKRIGNQNAYYCSRDCFNESRRKKRIKRLVTVLRRIRDCRVCGKRSLKVTCSRECELRDGRNSFNASLRKYHPICNADKECIDCGEKISIKFITSHSNQIRCNDCKKKRSRIKHNNGSHERRAKRAGVAYQYVIKEKVFERDNWRCHICKRKTPKRLMGTYNDNAPELDHIIPLSIGGPHVYSNVKCCCRECNGDKGSKALGQQMLFGLISSKSIISKRVMGAV
jgi:hypothetical protein